MRSGMMRAVSWITVEICSITHTPADQGTRMSFFGFTNGGNRMTYRIERKNLPDLNGWKFFLEAIDMTGEIGSHDA